MLHTTARGIFLKFFFPPRTGNMCIMMQLHFNPVLLHKHSIDLWKTKWVPKLSGIEERSVKYNPGVCMFDVNHNPPPLKLL